MNVPVMLRQARKAVAQENFVEAERLYALVLQDEAMQDMIDIQIRHAFCLEKTENIIDAIAVYQQVVYTYQEKGEVGAAKALNLKISILRNLLHKASMPSKDLQGEMETAQHELDVMYEDDDTVDFGGIDLFGLSTQEIMPQSNHQDTDESDVHVTLDLVPLEEEKQDEEHVMSEAYTSTIELIAQHEKAMVEKTGKPRQSDRSDAEAFAAIQDMIKEGIHQNVTHKSDIKDVNLEFTDIGDYSPSLSEFDLSEEVNRFAAESSIRSKAGELFGK